MVYFRRILSCWFLILFQTSILPCFSRPFIFLDFFILFIVLSSMYWSFEESIFFSLILGFIMDAVSGMMLGVYPNLYLSIVLLIKIILQFLYQERYVLGMAITFIAVSIYNFFIFVVLIFFLSKDKFMVLMFEILNVNWVYFLLSAVLFSVLFGLFSSLYLRKK